MPSVKIDLGRYVVLKRRADGTHRVLFQVPDRLRPSGWSPTIPLPLNAERHGRLDADEVAAIQRDAASLHRDLTRARTGADPGDRRRTLSVLVAAWQASDEYQSLKPKSKQHYGTYIRYIQTLDRGQDPTTLTRDDVRRFLAVVPGGPANKKHTLKTLKIVLEHAVAKDWRKDNPARGVKIKVPETRVSIWEQSDVDLYVKAAHAVERPSIALAILTMWEIGQRLTDLRAFRPGAEYDTEQGMFRFWQEKTGSYVTVPISAAVREALAEAAKGQLFLFRHEKTGQAYTENRLSEAFRVVREEAVKQGGRPLLLKWLRHSCVVQLSRRNVEIMQIRAITGHSPASIHKIVTTYCPKDDVQALAAQRARGLI